MPQTPATLRMVPFGPAQCIHVTADGTMRVVTAEQQPALFAMLAVLAFSRGGRASRAELRELLYPRQPDAYKKAVQRFRAGGWLEPSGDEREVVTLAATPVVPGLDHLPIHDWMQMTPGRVFVLDSLADRFTPQWMDWIEAQRENWSRQIASQLEALGEQAWASGDIEGGRAMATRLATVDESHPALRRWRVHRQNTRPADTTRSFNARWPHLPRPALEARLAERLRLPATPCVVHLYGEAGIGKSTLVERLLVAASAWGAEAPRVLRTAGQWVPPTDVPGGWRPSAGLADLLRTLLGMRGALGSSAYRTLADRLTQGRENLRDLSSGDLIAAALDVLAAVRSDGTRPLWWIVDDMHFLDPAVERVLTAALAAPSEVPWAVIGLSREAAPSAWREMEQRGHGAWSWINVPPLPATNVPTVAHALDLPEEDARSLHELSAGHPFRWMELTRRVLAGQVVGASRSIEQVLVEEVQAWSDEEQRVAGAILYAGDLAFPDVVASAAVIAIPAVESTMEDLEERGVTTRTETSPRRWTITTDRWRDAIARGLLNHQVMALHARLATIFETHPILSQRLDVRLQRLAHLCGGYAIAEALKTAPTLLPDCAALGAVEQGIKAWQSVLELAHDQYGVVPATWRDQFTEVCLVTEHTRLQLRHFDQATATLLEQVYAAWHHTPADAAHAPSLGDLLPHVRRELPLHLQLHIVERAARLQMYHAPWPTVRKLAGVVHDVLHDYYATARRDHSDGTVRTQAAALAVMDASFTRGTLPHFVVDVAMQTSEGMQRRPIDRLRYLLDMAFLATGNYDLYWDLRQVSTADPWREQLGVRDERYLADAAAALAIGDHGTAANYFAGQPKATHGQSLWKHHLTRLALATADPATSPGKAPDAEELAAEAYVRQALGSLVTTQQAALGPMNSASLFVCYHARRGQPIPHDAHCRRLLRYDYDEARHALGDGIHARVLLALAVLGEHDRVREAMVQHRNAYHEAILQRGWTASYRALAAYYGLAESKDLLNATEFRPRASLNEAWHHALSTVPTLPVGRLAAVRAGTSPVEF